MAKLRELIIKISANSASFQSEIARASRLGADYYRTMEKGGRQAASASRNSQQAMRELNGQLASVRDTAKGMAGAFAGMFATGRLISMADSYNSLNARIKLATTSTEDFKNAQQGLLRISQYTGSTFESNASLFTRVSASLREYGYSTKDILSLTDSLATGLQVSGASAEETSSLIVQLSQALGRGVLRGQDFNSVAQSGQRIMKALSDGLGVAQKDLKQLADAGELTTPKIVPALIGQLKTLHKEFDTMPNSVSAASNRVMNAFQQWVGEANQTTSATATLSGVLDGVAKNIDTVAAAGAVLVAVGAARFFGGMISGAVTATGRILETRLAEVALAEAQVRGTQISTARARAAVYRAQQALVAARNTDKQAQAETRLTQAQTRLGRNIDARTAAQGRLNSVTSVGSRMAGGMLGLVGGIPGLVMLGAMAWYTIYQNQEQARQSAQEYARTISEIPEKIPKMSLPEAADNEKEARNALDEQNRLIDEQAKRVNTLKSRIEDLNKSRNDPANLRYRSEAHLAQVLEKATGDLAVEQSRLNTLQGKAAEVKQVLTLVEQHRIGLIHQEKEKQDAVRHSLLMMNGEYSEFNRLMTLGNRLLEERNLQNITAPVTLLNDRQTQMLEKAARDRELSTLQGEAKIRRQAEFAADDEGLKSEPQYQSARQKYINDSVAVYQNGEKAREAQAATSKATSEAAKAAREAASAQENYRNKVADLNREIQVEQVRMKDGETAATLFAASMEISAKYTGKQREELIHLSKASILAKQRTQDLHDAIESDPYRKAAAARQEAEEQLQRQVAAKDIQSAEESARRKQEINLNYLNAVAEANQRYAVSPSAELVGKVDPLQDIQNQLERRKALIQTYATEGLITEQRKNELIIAADNETNERRYEAAMQLYASQGRIQKMTVNLFVVTQERMSNMLTGMLTGTQSFKDGMIGLFASLTQSIIQNLMDMAAEAILTSNTLKAIMGVAGGLFGGAGGGGTTLANGQAVPMLPQNISVNAKGGVYDSPSLSAYSGQVVSTPTFFAFAKGAGLMGEAGPEAIMPLARTGNGSLGVRLVGGNLPSSNGAPNIQVYITDSGGRSQAANGADAAFGENLARAFAQVYYAERDKDLRPGGTINRAIRGR
ncbi:tape measure protein [Xenorhabdus bovienii]|uniref:Tape measure protein n=2 Tax=Xenorhabdus bovienii TaxID=40576 RepID=A0AAJ1J969_XENBV|nr:phage tail tape measure protein [Xenorhabdus bovienii]MDE1479490.1 tape measure protein [Xenorhabdus bovienii]MDE1488015.1 tape measure protein [Xenorhabdus bovienii]MDE9478906.1 tape measure protein [Xenorhabdus bovienii]MDE9511152.1 tape measure protein [Xenorhabdus bovienii]MDE9522809.1 tape measure protein [Xenorhabdus bovienii]